MLSYSSKALRMYQMHGQYPCTAHAISARPSVCLVLSLSFSLTLFLFLPVYILAHVWANMAYTQCHSFSRARFVANLKIESRFNSILFNFYFIAAFSYFI